MNLFKPAVAVSASRFLALILWACGTFALGAYEVFNPNNLPTGPNPPVDTPYTAWNGSSPHWIASQHSGTDWQWGPKTMMFVYVRATDGNMPSMKTPAQLQTELDNTSQFYFDESFRRTWFGTKVINPGQSSQHIVPRLEVVFVNLPRTVSEYSGNHNFSRLTSDTFAAVRALGGEYASGQRLDPANFDRIQVFGDPKLITSTGLANVRGRYSWSGNGLSGWVVRHELGHNWGVYHANLWTGNDGIPRNASGTHQEYGAGADIMSIGFGSFNTMFKNALNFLHRRSGDVAEATSSGTYRIFAHTNPESNRTETRVRGLIVPVEGFAFLNQKLLILGFRHTSAAGGIMTRDSWDSHAVTVHANRTSPVYVQNNGSHLIDTSPNSWAADDRVDASIKVGRTYSEGPNVNGTHIYGGMHITALERGSLEIDGVSHYYMDVRINYGMSPGNQPPSASFSQAMFYGAEPGQPFTFSVNASDPDGDELAFDWNFGDDTYNVLNSGTQTKTWSEAGIYLVSATVSDMKGGVTHAQAWVNVGGIPLRSPDQPPATLPGLQYRYHQGPYTRLPSTPRIFPLKEGVVDTFTLAPRMRDRDYAFVFEGYLEVPSDDIYTFHVLARDGHRLYIGGQLMTERDGTLSSPSEDSANIGLSAGLHAIRVEMFNSSGGGTLSVDWSTLAMERTAIPAARLHHRDWSASGPMSVSILDPVPGATRVRGEDLPIRAGVSASTDIERVVFFVGYAYLGEDTAPPYEASWERISPGTWMLHALAIDTEGRQVLSDSVSLHVPPPPRGASIGINFLGPGGDRGRLESTDEAGARHVQRHWNNGPAGSFSSTVTHWDHTMNTLVDDTGATVTGAWTRYRSRHHNGQGDQFTLADTATANGRLFYSGLITRHDQRNPEVEVHGIPYDIYDVYVYFDLRETNAGDLYATEFVLTPLGGTALPSLFGQNSLVAGDGIGDYPHYDRWFGFQEATATSRTDPAGERLGNYVVFRGVTGETFHLLARKNPDMRRETGISAIQIVNVEIPDSPPVIVSQPSSLTVAEGTAAQFTVVANGSPPPAYQWRKHGEDLDGQTAPVLTLSSVTSADAGSYSVWIDNGIGAGVLSNMAVLAVLPPVPVPQSLSAQTLSSSAIALSWVDGAGPSDPAEAFRLERSPEGSGDWTVLATVQSQHYTDSGLAPESSWTYRVTALRGGVESVPSGTVSATTQAPPPEAPVITHPPQPQTVDLGGTAQFAVTATGSPAPSYQWYRNGDAIPGATGVLLEVQNVRYEDEGLYHVRVSNTGGHAESDPVWLEATLPPGEPQLFARINFQTNIDAPAGWLRDIGEVYGDRGNGFHYGWNPDNTATARRRNAQSSPSLQHDTLIHMQLNGSFTWEIAVPNGTYQVRVVAGDPGHFDSTYRINVEDSAVVDGAPTSQNRWVEGEASVEVSDGRLTVSNAAGAVNNKINFIEIHTVPEVMTGYEDWAAQLPPGQRAMRHLNDGVPNLLRYALGGEADTPASALRIVGHIHAQGIQVQFPRINDPQLTYELWGSGDLIHWGDEPVWWGTGGGPDTLLLENPPPLWFLQLRVRHQ